MEGGGGQRRVEAESSSSSVASARFDPSQSSYDLGEEESKVEENDDEVDGDEETATADDGFVPSPLIPLKDQLDKDKEDESLRRWKEKLLGCMDGNLNGQIEPEVIFHSIGVISEGYSDAVTSLPIAENQSRVLFTLKEGSKYCFKLLFSVKHNIVSGLTYSNIVWKRGLKVAEVRTWIKARECLVRLLLNVIPMSICLRKKLLHLGCSLEESTLRNSSLRMMIIDVIWSSTIPLKSRSVDSVFISYD
ncbi:hypothetical protein ZIOFF_068710 [Zingiber officinale]|uniref:Rho GDP-dissociation inhibitor 1 n=1 Tax=Zingiber officinale TaxID=94328 RepID=A0A8J5CHB2_ZINOF|nr:hypothetical protein ZIOFF_068710 [Zingiber officinale]